MVAGLLRELLSTLLREEAADPRLGLITVTGVRVSSDLCHARVYVSRLGNDAERDAAVAALNHAAPFFRREIARRTRLRRAPELVFQEDTGLETGLRVERLLESIRGPEPRSDDPGPPDDAE
jgi:ribosome-binding factor A